MGSAYADNIQMFYQEHMHEDEEIRYILEGGGYFDVRDEGDRWVRIEVGSGDLLVLPAGIYHRFTVDEGNKSECAADSVPFEPCPYDHASLVNLADYENGMQYIKAMRLFQNQPKWTALYRGEESEKNDVRKAYLAARVSSL
ncbi:MAG: hypothetical protein LQ348_007675 [Seirophora lacunosa]|nr:MAG: hypothetical protein LQ348_007675 [Seirophora lacunosa]